MPHVLALTPSWHNTADVATVHITLLLHMATRRFMIVVCRRLLVVVVLFIIIVLRQHAVAAPPKRSLKEAAAGTTLTVVWKLCSFSLCRRKIDDDGLFVVSPKKERWNRTRLWLARRGLDGRPAIGTAGSSRGSRGDGWNSASGGSRETRPCPVRAPNARRRMVHRCGLAPLNLVRPGRGREPVG